MIKQKRREYRMKKTNNKIVALCFGAMVFGSWLTVWADDQRKKLSEVKKLNAKIIDVWNRNIVECNEMLDQDLSESTKNYILSMKEIAIRRRNEAKEELQKCMKK
jgi:hypothetical protein